MFAIMLLVVLTPFAMIAAVAGTAAHRERARRALRQCPACRSRSVVRALAWPPFDAPFYRSAAHAFRCTGCGAQLFEVRRGAARGLMTGEQLVAALGASTLPSAKAHYRLPPG